MEVGRPQLGSRPAAARPAVPAGAAAAPAVRRSSGRHAPIRHGAVRTTALRATALRRPAVRRLPAGDRAAVCRTSGGRTSSGWSTDTQIYAEVDPLTGAPRDAIFMSPDDAARLHLCGGDRVALVSEAGRFEGCIFLAPIARGNLQVHWPEGNVLIVRGPVDMPPWLGHRLVLRTGQRRHGKSPSPPRPAV